MMLLYKPQNSGCKGSPVTTSQWHGCLSTSICWSSQVFNLLFLASAKSALTDEKLSDSVRCLLNGKYFWNLIAPGISIVLEHTSDELGHTCLRCNKNTMQRFLRRKSFLHIYTKGHITPLRTFPHPWEM